MIRAPSDLPRPYPVMLATRPMGLPTMLADALRECQRSRFPRAHESFQETPIMTYGYVNRPRRVGTPNLNPTVEVPTDLLARAVHSTLLGRILCHFWTRGEPGPGSADERVWP